MTIGLAKSWQGLLSVLSRSRIDPDRCGVNDKGMPAFYDVDWNNFHISVRPTDLRRFKPFRNIPFWSNYLSGSTIELVMTIDDLSGGNRTILYNWSLNRVMNSDYSNVNGEPLYFRCEAKPGRSVIYNKRLHMDGKHTLGMQFSVDDEVSDYEVMAEFTIFDRDTAMLKRSQAIGCLILAGIITLLIKLFVG